MDRTCDRSNQTLPDESGDSVIHSSEAEANIPIIAAENFIATVAT